MRKRYKYSGFDLTKRFRIWNLDPLHRGGSLSSDSYTYRWLKKNLPKRFWSDQWAAALFKPIANQWVAWGGRFHSNQFKTTFWPPPVIECRFSRSALGLGKLSSLSSTIEFCNCWGSVTFWCGSGSVPVTDGSGSDSFLLWLEGCKKPTPTGTLSSVLII